MRSRFQQGLDELKEKLLRMGGLAEQAIDRATEAYRTRDSKFCQMVLTGEGAINEAEREIDELALDLLAMQQPMAVDLRFILAVLKINADLERVGDQAVNIAQRVLDLISEPEVLLMDEPASALDPISTSKIEELIFQLKQHYTVVIVTHNMQQAARVAELTGFFLMGSLIEYDKTEKIFTTPADKRTEDYVTGRFG